MKTDELKACACADNPVAVSAEECAAYLACLSGWVIFDGQLSRSFRFENFHATMAFVNAVAWIAHTTDHHPALEVGYNTCRVNYHTHSLSGLSLNDFICAARIDALAQ